MTREELERRIAWLEVCLAAALEELRKDAVRASQPDRLGAGRGRKRAFAPVS